MLTIEEIQYRIAGLKSLANEEEQMMQAIDDIFYDLIYEIHPLYVAFQGEKPYMAPAKGENRWILRFFSHKEVAEDYVNESSRAELALTYREVSAVETMQIAKTALLRGGYGVLLNEGNRWILIYLANYIKLFLERVLKDERLVDEGFIKMVTVMAEILYYPDHGLVYHITGDGDASVLWIHPGEEDGTDEDRMTIDVLRTFSGTNVKLQLEKEGITVTKSDLWKAAMLSQAAGSWEEYGEEWRTENISLTFSPRIAMEQDADEYDFEDEYPIDQEPEATSYGNQKEISPKEDSAEEDVFQLIKLPELTKVKDRFGKKSRKKQTKAPVLDSSEPIVGEVPRNEAPAEKPGAANQPSQPKSASKGRAVVTILVLAMILGSLWFIQYQQKQTMETFRAYVDAKDYGNAYILYTEESLGEDGRVYMKEAIDQLVLDYAENRISAEELNASLQAIAAFPAMENEVNSARLVATKLEESKNSYVKGKEAATVYERLDLWRTVNSLDRVNFEAVKTDVEQNESAYIEALVSEIEYYSKRILIFAKNRYEVLAYWYPDSNAAKEWEPLYQTGPSTPLSVYPVSVSEISIHQESNGYWTLHIDWKNTSVKTIQTIRFSLVALDEKGEVVVCKDTNGTWSIYDAEDPGPHRTGEGTPSEDYNWHHAWYGPNVAMVKLTGVNILYTDGSESAFVSEVDLNKIQGN